MKAEWERTNITYFGTCVSDSYQLFLKEPVASLAELRGKRIIGVPTSRPGWSRWARRWCPRACRRCTASFRPAWATACSSSAPEPIR
jgi:hypothetical protein